MKKPTFAIAVTFQIKPEFVDNFRDRIFQQASDSLRLEEDCCQFDVLTSEDDPTTFFLYETYSDAAAFDAHKTTPHFADYDRAVAPWIAAKQINRLNLLENPS
ncbi:Autoinducer 2-degrading protein LsrG [Rubripirellula amarantea]|uniref:Autoinducer 2-degrading protein LsrG n=1 Tax=Rubripirellula amarantea TaxID=2527999 RepID=A0A5C5WGC4_9BACT|nr:putative quinol monooxygenase [Rubripirellula amarantea]TWT49161.1 Autoinducer 2-degrading protein LsrG [Rubripirellula amarantea]